MAHAIDQTTGRAAVFVVGEPAWHRLGVVIENATTSAEAIGLAGLDWRVEQWPVRAFDPDNHGIEAGIPDTVANVRTDTKAVLGVVGTPALNSAIEVATKILDINYTNEPSFRRLLKRVA